MAKRVKKMLPRVFAVMLSVSVMTSFLSVPTLASGSGDGNSIEAVKDSDTEIIGTDGGTGGTTDSTGGSDGSTSGTTDSSGSGDGSTGGTTDVTGSGDGSTGGNTDSTESGDGSTGGNTDSTGSGDGSTSGTTDSTGSGEGSIGGNTDSTGSGDGSISGNNDSTESGDGSTGGDTDSTGNGDGSTNGTTDSTAGSSDGSTEGENEKYPEQSETVKTTDVVFNQEAGKFEVTFRVDETAEGDQTFVLSDVMNIINQQGADKVAQDNAAQEWIEGEIVWVRWGEVCEKRFTYDGVEYIVTLAPADNETGYSQTVALYQEPGCTTAFDVILSNGSKHTYAYKGGSLNVSTPDLSGTGADTGVTGFDGQALPEKYRGGGFRT